MVIDNGLATTTGAAQIYFSTLGNQLHDQWRHGRLRDAGIAVSIAIVTARAPKLA